MSNYQTSAQPKNQDRREFGRRRDVWHAWIMPSSLQRLPCCVRNVSEGGALLELAVPEWLPASFDLFIDGLDLRLGCELRHRGKHGVGVTFADNPATQDFLHACSIPSGVRRSAPAPAGFDFAPPRLTSQLIRHALFRPEK